MRIQVDKDRCEGHGMCEGVAPDIFSLGDDGPVQLKHEEVEGDLQRRAETGVRACPVAALKLLNP